MVSRVLAVKLRRDLARRKGAITALLLIVAIGIGCLAAMSSLHRNLDQARREYYREYRLADFTVDLKRAPPGAIEALAKLPNVAAVQGRVSLPVRVQLPATNESILGQAISMRGTQQPLLNDVLLRSGSWFSGPDAREVILNEAFARENGLAPGDRIRVLFLDREESLLVVGTAMSPEFVYLIPASGGFLPDPAHFGVMYLPERFLREASDLDGAYNQVLGKVHDRSETTLLNSLALIESKLDRYGVTQATPFFNQPSVRYLADELAGLKTSAIVMPLIFLIVAALVLNLLIGRMVMQQRSIIGTLKALGYGNGQIARHYLAFGAAIGLMGGLLGALLGVLLQDAMLDLYRQFFALPEIPATRYVDIFLVGLGVSLLCACLGTLKGLRLAASLSPADALRPALPEAGKRILPERWPALWRRLPFNSKMILRTVFRNPFRSAVGLFSAIIATALMVSSLGTQDALEILMDHEFKRVAHEDIRLSLRDPIALGAVSELAGLAQVSEVEPQLSVAVDLSHGARSKRVGVLGLPRNNHLYTPLTSGGARVVVPERGLLLDRKLAEILDVVPGDRVQLRPLVGRRERTSAPVIAVVDSYLGLAAYANMDYLAGLIGEQEAVNTLLANTWPTSTPASLLSQVRSMPEVLGTHDRLRSLGQLNATFGQTMGVMIGVLVLFAGMIAFGSVLNSALVSVSEREREVGTLRVVGYGPGRVASIFIGESLLLNGLGVLAGLPAGLGLNLLISKAYSTEMYRFPAGVALDRLLLAALFMFFFLGLAQIIIVFLIRRLRWLDLLNVRE